MKNTDAQAFYDSSTATMTYVVWNPLTGDAVVIDPLLDFDVTTQMVSQASLAKVLAFIRNKNLTVHWVFETHVHADHLSAARELIATSPGCQWAMSEKFGEVFSIFKKIYAWPPHLNLDNLGVTRWLKDGEEVSAGIMRIRAMATPGHTPACMTFQIGDYLFTGDALMMPDSGVGRCDFPGGRAASLYESIWGRLYSLPDSYQVFVGHDYRPGNRQLAYCASLGEQKVENIHIKVTTAKSDFIAFREGRDKTLAAPRLLDPSLDWNLGAHQIVKAQEV